MADVAPLDRLERFLEVVEDLGKRTLIQEGLEANVELSYSADTGQPRCRPARVRACSGAARRDPTGPPAGPGAGRVGHGAARGGAIRPGGRWRRVGPDRCGRSSPWPASRGGGGRERTGDLDGNFRYDPLPGRVSRVDVRFTPQADGSTLVELQHTGLDSHGPTWRRLRDELASPDGCALRRYGERAGS